MKKPWLKPMSGFALFLAGAANGTVIRFRLLPMLQPDVMRSAGHIVRTEDWAHGTSNIFYMLALAGLVDGLIGVLLLTKANREYIASLPHREQWRYWPWHGIK